MKIREVSGAYQAVLLVLSLALSAAAGCGGEETYADQHSADIEFDCQQTALCDPVFSANQDPITECIEDTSSKLNSMGDTFRTTYAGRVSRCRNYTGCSYFSCAQDDELFSLANGALIAHECQQANDCKVMTAMLVVPDEVTMCVTKLSEALDFAAVADRSGWAQRAQRCQPQLACAYIQCQ